MSNFAAQGQALKRYRSKGDQKVVVEHVTVNKGRQAIVGTVQTGGGQRMKADSNPTQQPYPGKEDAALVSLPRLLR
jgi:hypothetical protein